MGLSEMIVSAICRVEVAAAIWRKVRLAELTDEEAATLCDEFEIDFFGEGSDDPLYGVIPVTGTVLGGAARVTKLHGLRAYDAIQLASATAARAEYPDCRSFACFDETLRRAARFEGFELVPSERRRG